MVMRRHARLPFSYDTRNPAPPHPIRGKVVIAWIPFRRECDLTRFEAMEGSSRTTPGNLPPHTCFVTGTEGIVGMLANKPHCVW